MIVESVTPIYNLSQVQYSPQIFISVKEDIPSLYTLVSSQYSLDFHLAWTQSQIPAPSDTFASVHASHNNHGLHQIST